MALGPFVANLLLFGRVLRHAGIEVHHSRLVDALRALDWVGVRRRHDVRAALGAQLVHRHDDLMRFHQAFDLFFRARGESSSTLPLFSLGERPRVAARPLAGAPASVGLEGGDTRSPQPPTLAVGAYSAVGISRTKDFADFSASELEHARRVLSRLPWHLGTRRTRRWQRATGSTIDLRRVLRRRVMTGEVLDLPRRRRRTAPHPLVVIGDVSGSMERYSRMLLAFVYGLAQNTRHVESFVFATVLTRITREVNSRGSLREMARLVRGVQDWGGGTRIGDALRTFNTRWARRVMRNGPIVILLSDGWDRGDPSTLSREMARVRRSCRRVIWLNPLLAAASYEPLTRGMQAALRYVDDFLPAHNLASLEALADHLQSLPPRGRGSR